MLMMARTVPTIPTIECCCSAASSAASPADLSQRPDATAYISSRAPKKAVARAIVLIFVLGAPSVEASPRRSDVLCY